MANTVGEDDTEESIPSTKINAISLTSAYPLEITLSKAFLDCVLHSSFMAGDVVPWVESDVFPDSPIIDGRSSMISLDITSEENMEVLCSGGVMKRYSEFTLRNNLGVSLSYTLHGSFAVGGSVLMLHADCDAALTFTDGKRRSTMQVIYIYSINCVTCILMNTA